MRRRSAIAVTAIAALAATVSAMPSPAATAQIVDLHVHTAGIGAGGSGAFVNREMRENLRFRFYLRAFVTGGIFTLSAPAPHGPATAATVQP